MYRVKFWPLAFHGLNLLYCSDRVAKTTTVDANAEVNALAQKRLRASAIAIFSDLYQGAATWSNQKIANDRAYFQTCFRLEGSNRCNRTLRKQ